MRSRSRSVLPVVLAATVVVVFATAGCAVSGPGARRAPADPVAAARHLDGAPGWVAEPDADVDCGTADVGRSARLPASARRCLADAVGAGRSATVAWVLVTTEGDPVPSFARARPAGVDVVSTGAYDAYGSEEWSAWTCPSVADLPAGDGCSTG